MNNDIPALALSVRQPWAWAIIHAGKDVENRGQMAIRYMKLGRSGGIAIHAAKGMTRDEYDNAREFMAKIGVACPPAADLVRGAIIGTVEIDGVTSKSASPWFFGPRAIRILNPRAVDPIYLSGALGLFNWRDAPRIAPPQAAKWMQLKPSAPQREELFR